MRYGIDDGGEQVEFKDIKLADIPPFPQLRDEAWQQVIQGNQELFDKSKRVEAERRLRTDVVIGTLGAVEAPQGLGCGSAPESMVNTERDRVILAPGSTLSDSCSTADVKEVSVEGSKQRMAGAVSNKVSLTDRVVEYAEQHNKDSVEASKQQRDSESVSLAAVPMFPKLYAARGFEYSAEEVFATIGAVKSAGLLDAESLESLERQLREQRGISEAASAKVKE